MKHPFQLILSTGNLLFTATKNELYVFDLKSGNKIGEWIDTFDSTETIKEKVKKEQERQLKENESKKSKTESLEEDEPTKKKRKSNNSEPKIPTPGEGAPTIYNYIRSLKLSNDEKSLIIITDSDKSGIVFKLDLSNKNNGNILKLIKRQPFPKRPNVIVTSNDDSEIVMGDKFGDVYKIQINDPELKKLDSESDPLLGHVSMLTDLIVTKQDNDQEFIITTDRDEHIRISKFPSSFIIDKFLFGHESFISNIVIPKFNNNQLLISGGGDNFITLWNWVKGEELDRFQLDDLIKPHLNELHLTPSRFQNEENNLKEYCVSKIVALEKINSIAVLIESTNQLFIIKISDNFQKLELDKSIQFDSNIVTITASYEKVFVGLDNDSNLLTSIDIETREIDQSNDIINKVQENYSVEVNSRDEFYPLYTTYQLRKRSEH
ncbi:hypothetical protein WICMUC_001328 [Wickerhamomyces mucosus]|uniref:Transfer RNA methyltransferase 82 n=1 Tax=Wickerhamomyces mucosus TaxID=1378264 RepID=A0A9P8PWQ7_9ASCO|nr:hypothetical protein WICMUC_001328 [Wickerhamomyces mucosus]